MIVKKKGMGGLITNIDEMLTNLQLTENKWVMDFFLLLFRVFICFFEILTYVITKWILIGCYNAARGGGVKK